MAAYTRTKLDAVNEILETVKESRISALDSTGSWPSLSYGSTVAGDAEFMLDRAVNFELNRGWWFNTVRHKKYAGVTTIAFGSSVIRIVPSGPSEDERIALRSGSAFNLRTDSATLTSGDYFFHVVTTHEFSTIPLDIQNLIVKRAKREFHLIRIGDPAKNALLLGEYREAEAYCQRPLLGMYPDAMNQAPAPASSLAGGGQQQQ